MDYKLTATQKKLIEIAKEKGFLTLIDFNAAYSSPMTRKSVIERFTALGLLEDSVGFKWKYIGEQNE